MVVERSDVAGSFDEVQQVIYLIRKSWWKTNGDTVTTLKGEAYKNQIYLTSRRCDYHYGRRDQSLPDYLKSRCYFGEIHYNFMSNCRRCAIIITSGQCYAPAMWLGEGLLLCSYWDKAACAIDDAPVGR